MNEHDWDFFDELIEAYSLGAAQSAGLDDIRIRTKLQRVFANAMTETLTFEDMSSLLDSETNARDQVARKAAWIIPHIFKCKVWGVNAQLFGPGSAESVESPLVEQLVRAGLRAKTRDVTAIRDLAKRVAPNHQKFIDAIAFCPDTNTVFVVKAVSYTSAAKRSPALVLTSGTPNLWDTGPRLLAGARVKGPAVQAMTCAWGVLKHCFPHVNVRPMFFVVDDPDAGWHFQAHEFVEPCFANCVDRTVELDSHPVCASSLDHMDRMREDSNWLAFVPAEHAHAPLYCLPPDRPARALMTLEVMNLSQSGNTKELVPMRASDLSREVSRKFDLYYPVDMRRHDLEDCLRGRRMLLKLRDPANSYTITAVGLARLFLIIAKARRDLPPEFPQHALSRVFGQAELVWKNRNL